MNEDDYQVGYGRPPLHSRFQKGCSGNPRGRPKRSKNIDTLIERELDQLVTVKEAGREQRVSKREAIAKRLVNAALTQSGRGVELLFKYLRTIDTPEPFTMTADDEAEFRRALRRAGDADVNGDGGGT